MNSSHSHGELKGHFRFIHTAGNRSRRLRGRGGCQWDVTFSGEQSGGGIQSYPAGTRQKDFRPGMQVREVFGRTLRTFQRLQVRRQLNEVSGNKSRRESKTAEQMNQQPCRITT